jgi:serine/threonine-protein kinase Chk2
LPSPITHKESTASGDFKEGTVTPPNGRQAHNSQAVKSPKGPGGLSSPPSDTQPFSQFIYPPENRTYAVEDEEGEEVWGYLVPMDDDSGKVMVLRRRQACPVPPTIVGKTNGRDKVSKGEYKGQEEEYEQEKMEHGVVAGGYLIGRHRECGKLTSRFKYRCYK